MTFEREWQTAVDEHLFGPPERWPSLLWFWLRRRRVHRVRHAQRPCDLCHARMTLGARLAR